jgi:hypothetical protein
MSEIYKIIGLRDIDENIKKEFYDFIKKDSLEAQQIKDCYNNPLIVANILKCRIKCLEEA